MTYEDGTLVKRQGSDDIYIIENQVLRWIPDGDTFRWRRYKLRNVKALTDAQFCAYQIGNQLPSVMVRRIVRTPNDNRVWELRTDMRRKWISNIQLFRELLYSFSNVQTISPKKLNIYERISLIRGTNDDKVYYIPDTDRPLKHLIPSVSVFKSYKRCFNDVLIVSQSELCLYGDSNLIRQSGQTKIYLLENGEKRWIPTLEIFRQHGYDMRDVVTVSGVEFAYYPEGEAVN